MVSVPVCLPLKRRDAGGAFFSCPGQVMIVDLVPLWRGSMRGVASLAGFPQSLDLNMFNEGTRTTASKCTL